jgi:1-phosphofructokinase family hexose kinase
MIYTLTLNPALDMELTVDHLEIGQVHRARQERCDVGGKGFNVSRVLNRLGVANIAVGIIAGATGNRLKEGLEDSGIQTDLLMVAGETRTNISIVGSTASEYIKVNQAGAAVSPEDAEKLLNMVSQRTGPTDLWILSGSLPPGMAVDYYAQIIACIREKSGHALLDTSGAALKAAVGAGVRLVKPNAEEAESLTGTKIDSLDDAIETAAKIRALGVDAVVISLGGLGLAAVDAKGAWIAQPPEICLRNPVGAGDALVAGLAAGIHDRWDLPASIRLGTACGASAAAQPGTGVGSLEEITSLQSKVVIKQVR